MEIVRKVKCSPIRRDFRYVKKGSAFMTSAREIQGNTAEMSREAILLAPSAHLRILSALAISI